MPLITPDLAAFLQGEAMIILGTQADGQAEIGRALGATVEAVPDLLTVHLSAWQWPGTLANLRANGRLAATFSRPVDYASFQVKGRVRHILPAGDAQRAAAARYSRAMARVLAALGVPPQVSASWRLDRDLVAVTIAVEAAFQQTPGPDAGAPLATHDA